MALDQKKYEHKHETMLRDVRPLTTRLVEGLRTAQSASVVMFTMAVVIMMDDNVGMAPDLCLLIALLYLLWLRGADRSLPMKLPKSAKYLDPHNKSPGSNKPGKPDGILYVGNEEKTGKQLWFTNSDARTHILYLGTTGAGKTEGLKSLVTNAMCWGSGYIYVDGKADTNLWSSLSALTRRFGRDDDLMVLNYMTGNSGARATSNTLNPFSTGSASYLTNMLVSLMPDAEGDNAMWKERAVSLIGSVMPALTYMRDERDIPLSVSRIRKFLEFASVIKLSRDESVPEKYRIGVISYLKELPGYVDDAFDDDGQEKPMPPDAPMIDTSVPRQQHGYLSMQFTRALQSLGDDYGYIFDTQGADVDMVDLVLNRRILVVLIPALEKSADETANLGKIIAATLKGMMGSTLGATVEGDVGTAIENKPTNSATPFMAVFDEVGYYTAQGMAVMAAQARSLGFCLVYAGQDLPAMEKRVKEEARSIAGNTNIKIFGKLEDPTTTKEFFEKTVGQALVTEVSSFGTMAGGLSNTYMDNKQAGVQVRSRANYEELRGFSEGQAIVAYGEAVVSARMFFSNPGNAQSMRVGRFLTLEPPDEAMTSNMKGVQGILSKLRDPNWTAASGEDTPQNEEITAMVNGFALGEQNNSDKVECGALAIAAIADMHGTITEENDSDEAAATPASVQAGATMADGTGNTQTSATGASLPGTDTGPMTWDAIMGDSADSGTSQPTASSAPPVTAEAPISWDAIMGVDSGTDGGTNMAAEGAIPVPDSPSPAAPPGAPPSMAGADAPFPWEQDRATTASTANHSEHMAGHADGSAHVEDSNAEDSNADLGEPLSWMDIIGELEEGDDQQDNATPEEVAMADNPFSPVETAHQPQSGSGANHADENVSTGTQDVTMPWETQDMSAPTSPTEPAPAPSAPPSTDMHTIPAGQTPSDTTTSHADDDGFDVNEALKAATRGESRLPAGLSPEVQDILREAAQTISSGLFAPANEPKNTDIDAAE